MHICIFVNIIIRLKKSAELANMLEQDRLEKTLTALIKGKQDLILYGNKSSGKTYFATNLLNNILGKDYYLTIKGIFISDRDSLLYMVGDEMIRLFKKLDSSFVNENDQNKKSDKENRPNFMKEQHRQTMDGWLKNINKFTKIHQDFFKKLPRIYLFIDNIQQLNLNEQFFKEFYFGIKNQLNYLKISFFFCGVSYRSTIFTVYEPIRLIPSFFMPKPCLKKVIKAVIDQSALVKKLRSDQAICDKLTKHLFNTLYNTFQSIQFQMERMRQISQSFITQINQHIGHKPENAKIFLQKEQYKEQEILNKLKTYGPITLERLNNQSTKKNIGTKETEQGSQTFYLQNYPNLIMTSLGLANGFNQANDRERFMDLGKTKSKRDKANMRFKNTEYNFKPDPKKVKHTKQRIVAISEVLEEQSKNTNHLKQRDEPHHTLDYYGCFEYLREEGNLNFYGKGSGKYGGTITGNPKESEIKDFMIKTQLSYKQFTGRD